MPAAREIPLVGNEAAWATAGAATKATPSRAATALRTVAGAMRRAVRLAERLSRERELRAATVLTVRALKSQIETPVPAAPAIRPKA